MKGDKEANALFTGEQPDKSEHPEALDFIWNEINQNYTKIHQLEGTNWEIYKNQKK